MQRKGTFTNEDSLFEQMANISKAGAYDILVEQVKELKHENAELKIKLNGAEERIKALKEFINDVRPKEATVIEMPRCENDLPSELFSKPGSPPIMDIL